MMAAPEPGSEIDGFRLGELIHVGTMAWVYRLIGPDGPLPLIMKIPRLGAGERAMNVVSFEQCRLVLGALAQGPHYPTLVAYGDVETTPYLVMEYIEGERLNEWTRRAPVQPQEIARIGAAVALALHEIHRQDVIHLDLKSTNILFRHDGKAALVDFGLSHHGHYPDLLAEEFRYPVGNWEYMSPEQIFGIRCDPRSDIFSFGALLYELATGQLPFGSPQSLSQLRGRLYGDAVPPSVRVAAVPHGSRKSFCIAWKSTIASATSLQSGLRSIWQIRARWRSASALPATGAPRGAPRFFGACRSATSRRRRARHWPCRVATSPSCSSRSIACKARSGCSRRCAKRFVARSRRTISAGSRALS
jgi:serine/threonine protein kinase